MEMRGWRWMLLVLLLAGRRFGDTWNRSIGQHGLHNKKCRQRRILTKEANGKKALKIAEEFESAAKTNGFFIH
jgi:hypothetical protein